MALDLENLKNQRHPEFISGSMRLIIQEIKNPQSKARLGICILSY